MSDVEAEPYCFVVMPFRSPYNQIYKKVISPAAENVGLRAVRGDDIFAAGDIVGQVVEAIVGCELVICEISEINANVYYEIGLAHAYRRPSVLLSRSSDTIPFDLRTGRCVIYDVDDPEWGRLLQADLERAVIETRENPLRALPLAISSAGASASTSSEPHTDALTSLSLQLDQVSQAVARLVPGLLPTDHRTPDADSASLVATAGALIASGKQRDEVIGYLVRSGASTPWAEFTVDNALRDR